MYYIATFYSHFGAIRFKREAGPELKQIKMMPVPRNLSSSCGTCVRFQAPEDYMFSGDSYGEIEQVVRVEDEGYQVIYKAEG